LDETTPVLVNDLDFWIVGPDNTIYYPWTLDPANPSSPAVQTKGNHLDNVEQVLIDQPAAGTYQIHVGHTGAIATSAQDYSLLVGGTVGSANLPIANNDDTISVDDTGFGGGLAVGTLLETQFVLGTAAADTSDRFIYNQSTGALFFDIDGTGATAKIQIATLTTKPVISFEDIVVI
jgi:Ca2+-binding RTX toxin-like protein